MERIRGLCRRLRSGKVSGAIRKNELLGIGRGRIILSKLLFISFVMRKLQEKYLAMRKGS